MSGPNGVFDLKKNFALIELIERLHANEAPELFSTAFLERERELSVPCDENEVHLVNIFVQQYHDTVGARIPNAFGIRMVCSCSVLVPTIRKQNFQNGRFRLGCFIYKEKKCIYIKRSSLKRPFLMVFGFRTFKMATLA